LQLKVEIILDNLFSAFLKVMKSILTQTLDPVHSHRQFNSRKCMLYFDFEFIISTMNSIKRLT